MENKYYSVEQISSLLGLHPKTVQRYIREGRLRAQKFGKAWRVTGHDLSTFAEGTSEVVSQRPASGLQSILSAARPRIRISAVIDVPVANIAESAQVASWITSAINSRPDKAIQATMTSQYIADEKMIRIMLWGSPAVVAGIMNAIDEMDQEAL